MGIQRSKYKRDSATSKYKLGQPSGNGGGGGSGSGSSGSGSGSNDFAPTIGVVELVFSMSWASSYPTTLIVP
jgi:hypothetical protein